jgi:hypothetical protein
MVHLPARQMTVLGPDFATDANGAPYLQVMQQKRSYLTPSDIGTSALVFLMACCGPNTVACDGFETGENQGA